MKLFHLYRREDLTGVSGTGPVVEGVEFTNGWCAIRWLSNKSTLCFYSSLEDVKSIHGHGGRTELIVHDFEPARRSPSGLQFEKFLEVIESISAVVTFAEEQRANPRAISLEFGRIRQLLDELEKQILAGGKRAA